MGSRDPSGVPLLAVKDVVRRLTPALLAADTSEYGLWQAVPCGVFHHSSDVSKQWHTEHTRMLSIANLLREKSLRPEPRMLLNAGSVGG